MIFYMLMVFRSIHFIFYTICTESFRNLQLIHELWKEDGALFRVIRNMNFGQFLFLYYFARNTPCVVSVVVLEKLREKTCIRENENQTRKIHSSTLPSYKSSWDNLEANAPTDSMTEEYKGPKTHRQSSSRQDLRKSRQGAIVENAFNL